MNVKAGDLAIIISTNPPHDDCLGRIVTALDMSYKYLNEAYWRVEFAGSPPTSTARSHNVYVRDSCLKPVSGLPLTEDETTDLKEPA